MKGPFSGAVLPYPFSFAQVYADYESNPQLRQAIEFACRQFYILHRKPFILQLFASVAPLLEFPVSKSHSLLSAWGSPCVQPAPIRDHKEQTAGAAAHFMLNVCLLHSVLHGTSFRKLTSVYFCSSVDWAGCRDKGPLVSRLVNVVSL